MGYVRCNSDIGSKEFIIIHWNEPSNYGCRWFFLDKDGKITLVNTSSYTAGYEYTYSLSDGSTLKVSMQFSSSYWHATFTSSKKRKIKINLKYDGTGPTEYTLNANTAKTVDIAMDTVWTNYNAQQSILGGCGLIVEV